MSSQTTRQLLLFLPALALLLSACNAGGITGSGELDCDTDLLTGIFSHDNNEDLSRCLQGRRPLTGG
jgi:hypothetical protein